MKAMMMAQFLPVSVIQVWQTYAPPQAQGRTGGVIVLGCNELHGKQVPRKYRKGSLAGVAGGTEQQHVQWWAVHPSG